MYVKIFSQIYDSSIAEDYLVRFVFEDFLILADKDGHVDMTAAAIARRTNVPLRIVKRAIERLSSPDADSRTPDEDGRRIALLDPHRSWGWRIVNYSHYRNIRDDEARKEYFRERKQEQRTKSKNVLDSPGHLETVKDCPAMSPRQKQEADAFKKHAQDIVERIYQAYPRRVGKAGGLKAIERALRAIAPVRDQQWLLARVQRYAELRVNQDDHPKFTPYPATWFNEGRYDDESLNPIETTVPQSGSAIPLTDVEAIRTARFMSMDSIRMKAGLQ